MQKIMFNEQFGLQQATFDGIKTMTRRIVPDKVIKQVPAYQEKYYAGALEPISVEDAIMQMCGPEHMFHVGYEVGEIVAVAQSYEDVFGYSDAYHLGLFGRTAAWDNKMFVKAELMPRHIKITGKKVERLQAISDEDCLREGVFVESLHGDYKYGFYTGSYIKTMGRQGTRSVWFKTPRDAYAALIDKVSRKGTWKSNPYVYAYTYKLVD